MASIEIVILLTAICNLQAFELSSTHLIGCSGRPINAQATQCAQQSIIKVASLTIYATTNSAAISTIGNQCLQVSECKRVIHNNNDPGLSAAYKHLYDWFINKCQGKKVCGEGTLPKWYSLTGQITDNADSRICPESGTKYFTGILLDIQCVVGQEVATVPPPDETTPREKSTTAEPTTPFPVYIPIYLPSLEDREKIILAVAIGLAIAILIVLLLILYCCERYRKHKNFLKLLKMLGAPQAQDNDDDYDDYSKTETWTDEQINPDAIGEYTGVKPDEHLTMTKQAMQSLGHIMYDTSFGTMTNGRRNSCSTLNRNSGYRSSPNVESGINGYTGPMVYDTEENLDLERRMAEVLDSHEESVAYNTAIEGEENIAYDTATEGDKTVF